MASSIGWLAMVAAAVASLGCALAVRPWRRGTLLPALVMLAAMLDMATGHRLLPATAWAAVLIFVGVFAVAAPRSAEPRCDWAHGLALVAASVIMIGSPHALAAAHASVPGHGQHLSIAAPTGAAGVGGWPLGLLIALAYATVALAVLLRPSAAAAGPTGPTGRARRPPRLQLAQVAATTSCLALMALLSAAA